uniref:ABC1 atypical kinase-like domain-containing protein n=1 Tax=Pseudictyota dubia TaxID=2749911 RepID=A0A7R9W948_9STRA
MGLLVRACRLSWNFAPPVWTTWLAVLLPPFRRRVWFGMVGRSLAKSGPAFIKWGQWASTRADMFPDALCEAMSQLHSDAPAHKWSFTERTVEQSLCVPPGSLPEIFESFEMEPVASGSIAQVHRAVLRSDDDDDDDDDNEGVEHGTLVAVKVRHPRVSKLIDTDFRLMSIAADVVDHIPWMGWLRLRSSVEQFSHTMAAQAHLNVEAHHLEVLNHNFRNWKDVGFPKPFFSSAAVIMETFETGKVCTEVMDAYDRIAADGSEEDEELMLEDVGGSSGAAMDALYPGHRKMPVPMAKFIVGTGLSIYLKMLLIDNLMHADLHPGNLMLNVEEMLPEEDDDEDEESDYGNKEETDAAAKKSKADADAARRYRGHITMVDAGMVAQLDESESVNFIGLLSSLGEGDGRTAAEAVLRFSSDENAAAAALDDCGCDDTPPTGGGLTARQKEAFKRDMIKLFDEKCGGYGTDVDVGEVLRGVLGLIRDHHVRIDANYATLVVNALCIESLANRVCPSYNLLDGSKPLLTSFRKICQSKDGRVALCHRSKFRKAILKMGVPFLYLRKNLFDNDFFRRLEISRKLRRGQSPPVIVSSFFSGVVGLAGLLALVAKTAQENGLMIGLSSSSSLSSSDVLSSRRARSSAIGEADARTRREDDTIAVATRDPNAFLFGLFERWLRLEY